MGNHKILSKYNIYQWYDYQYYNCNLKCSKNKNDYNQTYIIAVNIMLNKMKTKYALNKYLFNWPRNKYLL